MLRADYIDQNTHVLVEALRRAERVIDLYQIAAYTLGIVVAVAASAWYASRQRYNSMTGRYEG